MIKAILSDFSRTVCFPTDPEYSGSLNDLHDKLKNSESYTIWDHYSLNDELLAYYGELRKQYDVYLFTTRYLQEWPEIKEKISSVFKKIYSVAADNLPGKKDPQAYIQIATDLGLSTESILFIDDDDENLEAAKQAGVLTVRFESERQAIADIKEKLAGNYASI